MVSMLFFPLIHRAYGEGGGAKPDEQPPRPPQAGSPVDVKDPRQGDFAEWSLSTPTRRARTLQSPRHEVCSRLLARNVPLDREEVDLRAEYREAARSG